MSDELTIFEGRLKKAIRHFWKVRGKQGLAQGQSENRDRGNRSAVTGGKHLDGFRDLTVAIVREAGLADSSIYWQRKTELPGWYRAEKRWDLLIVSEQKVVAILEFKSHVGSFGNNFNNRAEESLGNATDLWAAYSEGAFKPSERPWLGFLMLLEDSTKSIQPVSTKQPHFPVFPEFQKASYAQRYEQLLSKLVRSRLYDATCLLMTSKQRGSSGEYREPNPELSFHNFVTSLLGRVIAVAKMESSST